MMKQQDTTTCTRYFGSSSVWLLLLVVVASLLPTAHALFAEDAGKLDFLIATTGHGPVTAAFQFEDDVIVTGGSSSCHVAGRSRATGGLLWRRDAALKKEDSNGNNVSCLVTVAGKTVVTVDQSTATVRGWGVTDGSLLWDQQQLTGSVYQISAVGSDYVALKVEDSNKSNTVVLNLASGKITANKEAESEPPSDDGDERKQVFCDAATAYVRVQENGLVAISAEVPIGEVLGLSVDQVWLMGCERNEISVLATSRRGTTALVFFADDGANIVWTAEEGLAQVSSALMLDASHENFIKDAGQGKDILQLSSRLASQWKDVTSLLSSLSLSSSSSETAVRGRDHLFGFVKIAVLLSDSAHRVFGLETAGPKRTSLRFQIDLPEDALWHGMIHGSVNSEKGTHGINGGAHTREMLILSNKGSSVEWICIDGTSGDVSDKGTVPMASPIVQVIPLAGKGKCRQDAVLMFEDHSLVSVTGSGEDSLESTSNMYAHYLDKKSSTLYSFGIAAGTDGGSAATYLVGSAVFPGEEIVAVAYPPREEVIQSPCSVLGDDSLLLKYLNPHLTVIVTMKSHSDGPVEVEEDFPLKPKKKSKQKRKPVGVTQPGEIPKTEDKPNFFVNVVDTVSGRVLYRASHANALRSPRPSVLLSENWVFYTFTNAKTRKAELGVLSLYEGMIDKSGLTAFNSPEQLTSFSSLDARETKPVVLAKTFIIPMPATALGMTSTRSGISGRQLLLAGLDGTIHGIGRKMLEPRRPLGQVKDTEKKEGLVQYHELIQTVSYMALSHNQTVESVQSIITAPTDVESQTLILAFGGPDIFFSRTSPSKGFDLLPDNFNRVLLSIVVAGLVAALVMLRQLVAKKVVKQGWV